jgi:hypothetical protein
MNHLCSTYLHSFVQKTFMARVVAVSYAFSRASESASQGT